MEPRSEMGGQQSPFHQSHSRRDFLVRAGVASLVVGPAVVFSGSRVLSGAQARTQSNLTALDVREIALEPRNAVNASGTQHTVTARVEPVVFGIRIGFNVMSGPNAGVSGSALTNEAGRATFTYHGGGGAGTDTIVAWVDIDTDGMIDAGEPQASATKQWTGTAVAAFADIDRVELRPKASTNPLNVQHTVRARVHPHRSGVPVHFLIVVGPNRMNSAVTLTTNDDGFAAFTWAGTREGLDIVIAWVGASAMPEEPLDEARKLWRRDAVVQAAADSPETPESPDSPETPETPETLELVESPESPESPQTPESPEDRSGSNSGSSSTSGSSSGSGSSGSGSSGSGSGSSGSGSSGSGRR